MNFLKVKANVTQEVEIELPIPFFARSMDEKNYIGLLDGNTVVKFYKGEYYTSISNSDVDYVERTKLLEAFQNWHSCTETEFFEAYHKTIESISLHPVLAV